MVQHFHSRVGDVGSFDSVLVPRTLKQRMSAITQEESHTAVRHQCAERCDSENERSVR